MKAEETPPSMQEACSGDRKPEMVGNRTEKIRLAHDDAKTEVSSVRNEKSVPRRARPNRTTGACTRFR